MATAREQLTDSTLLQSYGDTPPIREFISVLDYFEKHVIVAHTDPGYRKAFRIGEPLSYFIANHEAEGLQICSNDKQTYHLANVLFNYRIVDIASWMKSSFKPLLPLQGVRRGKLPIPQLSRLVAAPLLEDWGLIVKNGLTSLRRFWSTSKGDSVNHHCYSDGLDPAAFFYASAVGRADCISFSNVLKNFEIAAFHLAYLLKGNLDLPLNFDELCTNDCMSNPNLNYRHVRADMRNMRQLRLPLHIAVAVSPVFLLLDICLSRKDLDRGSLIKAWACLGGDGKPHVLQFIERRLWIFMFDVALEARNFISSFETLMDDLENAMAGEVHLIEAGWFSDKVMNVPIQVNQEQNPIETATNPGCAQGPAVGGVTRTLNDITGMGRAEAIQAAEGSGYTGSSGANNNADMDGDEEDGRERQEDKADDYNEAKNDDNGDEEDEDEEYDSRRGEVATDQANSDEDMEELSSSSRCSKRKRGDSEVTDSEDRPEGDGDEVDQSPLPRRRSKRKRGNGKAEQLVHGIARSASKNRSKKKHTPAMSRVKVEPTLSMLSEVIDLTEELESDEESPEAFPLEDSSALKSEAEEMRFFGATEAHDRILTPAFHFEEDHTFFREIVQSYQRTHPDTPLFREAAVNTVESGCERPGSIIRVMTDKEFNSARVEEIQTIFSKQHILVHGEVARPIGFTKNSLLDLMREDQSISIIDMSIKVEDQLHSRLRYGTMADLLDHANEAGKALNALDIPMEDGVQVPPSLSSDRRAWTHTVGFKLCKKSNRFPNSAMRWALVSTSGTYSPWHIDCDGLGMVIEVKEGSKWWIIARPKPGESLQQLLSRIEAFIDVFDPRVSNADLWDCEAILLTPGTRLYMKPNTLHCVFTLEPTICHGGHFFATSTIRDSCIGLYHSFMVPGIITNTEHELATRELLRRMAAYYHSLYIRQDYPACDTAHLIQIDTFDGVVDFLTFCNLAEIANIVYSRTYGVAPLTLKEHYGFIQARQLCRTVLDWLDGRWALEGPDTHQLQSIKSVQVAYLRRQLRALIQYKQKAASLKYDTFPGGCTATVEAFERQAKLILDGKLEDPFRASAELSLGWPTGVVYVLHPKRSAVNEKKPIQNGLTLADRLFEAENFGDENSVQQITKIINERLGSNR